MALALGAPPAQAFTLIGPPNPAAFDWATYFTFAALPAAPTMPGGGAAAQQGSLNFVDPLGWPVPVKEFYRWNFPELTYAFDSSFIRFFGHHGMQAVHNSFRVLNDYFEPEDAAYDGVSTLDLLRQYDQHFSTWRFNPSANVGNVTDMQTLVTGLLVNHMGLGNPHRYCYVIRDIINYLANDTTSRGDFHVTLRNYDPFTYHPSAVINGVNHSYYIYSNPAYVAGAGGARPAVFDAVEYAVSSDNEFSAVAAIRDVINFGGLPWPQVAPTVFRTPGVFFTPEDSRNKPAINTTSTVRDQPRHTLTYDDAGGLRYLYRTNNVVFERLDASVTLVTLANMNPPPRTTGIPPAVPPNSPFNTPQVRTITGLVAATITPANSATGSIRPQVTTIVRDGLRGGINKIRFNYLPYDSLLGSAYHTNNSVWTDVFITNALPTDIVPANPPFFSQVVQRTTTRPDIIFIAQDLGVAGNVLPVIQIPDTANWDNSMIASNTQQGAAGRYMGPGVIRPPAATSIQYIFTTRAPFHQVVWSGQQGIEGNMVTQFQWGWITNTGPNDFIRFPEADITQPEGVVAPSGVVPEMTALSVLDGSQNIFTSPSTSYNIDRTLDTLIIYGRRLDTVSQIRILDHNTTVAGKYRELQAIDARRHIMSDQQIVLSPGTLNEKTVSPSTGTWYRRISLVNSRGESVSELLYKIRDGRPLIHATQYDGLPLNTTKSLVITGSGFRTANGNVNQIWFFDDNNGTNNALDPDTGTGVFPIPIAILDINATSAYVAPSGVGARNTDIVITDNSIYLPPHMISDGLFIPGGLPATFGSFGFGTLGQGNNMARSDGNSTDVTVLLFTKHIRVAINNSLTGQPNANVIISPARPTVQGFTQIGVGGERNSTAPGVGGEPTFPIITDVFTNATLPGAPVTVADANRTWLRGTDADTLTIRGRGLDLAVAIEFVDGLGNSIQSTDAVGLPPQPVSLRQNANPSTLATGVTIVPQAVVGSRDAYEIRISPVTFGMNGNALFDSAASTNPNQLRRVVIRTPFGTAIAPVSTYLMIQ